MQEERAIARAEPEFLAAEQLLNQRGPGALSQGQIAMLKHGWTVPVYDQRAREASERLFGHP